MGLAAIALAAPRPRAAPPMKGAPEIARVDGYAGSDACASCHPSEHASWSRTFHRTMTQRASTSTVLAPLDTPVEADGLKYTLFAGEGGSVWERTEHGDKERVLITTGSHHMQGYWVAAGAGALRMLPFVFARDEGELGAARSSEARVRTGTLIPRREAFVEPPSLRQHDVRWNSNCIQCHATAGRPGATDEGFDSGAAELGIACEACHGPGAAHVERHHDPLTRWAQRRSKEADPSIVNPARLPADRAAAVCGQCHAYAYPKDEDAFWRSGYAERFRPGELLDASRTLLSPAVLADPKGPKVDLPAGDLFWPDGTVRVAGREYNAMILSACYLRGAGERRLSCVSCHSMHRSDPDDQLRRDHSVQATCISCHTMPAGHSRHAPGSPGDACVACHMPKTSYALRRGVRSHRIDVPDSRAVAGRPNACNLCHLDRSLAWTVKTLMKWQAGVDVSPELPDVPEGAMGLLTKDAAERVLWADAMGDPDAIAASGSDWEAPLLQFAAEHDPYAVVRYVAGRSRHAVESAKPARSPAGVKMAPKDIASLALIRDNRDITVAE